jgi:hypothetical protein
MTLVTASTAITALVDGLVTDTSRAAPAWPVAGWLINLALSSKVVGCLLISSALTRSTSMQPSGGLIPIRPV